MTDAVVRSSEGRLLYDLAADTVTSPFHVNNGSKNYLLLGKHKALDFAAFKKLLSSVQITREQRTNDDFTELNSADGEQLRSIVDDTFQSLSGITHRDGRPHTPEENRSYLSKFPHIKEQLGMAMGFFNAISKPEGVIAASNGHLVFDFEESDQQEVATEVETGDPANSGILKIQVTHLARNESEADRLSFRKLTKMRVQQEGKKQFSWTTCNYDGVNRLYDSMVFQLNGAVVGNAECTEANRSEWLPKVPLPWKVYVLNQIFNRVESKKA